MRYWVRALFLISAILLAAFNINSARAQALDEAFLHSTVLVYFEKNPQEFPCGSGFFMLRKVGKDVLLITNKHVLEPVKKSQKSIKVRVNVKSGETPQGRDIDIPVVGQGGEFLSTVKFHPKFDIAVVNVTDTIKKENIHGRWIPEELLVTSERLKTKNITIGDEVFLLGFPDEIYDPRNVFPILRTGVIATSPTDGFAFNKKLRDRYGYPEFINGFLIDAHVFSGSSGSMVILKQQPFTLGPSGKTIFNRGKRIPYILGIVVGSIPITLSNGVQQYTGLGEVHSANAIIETIEQLYR